MNDNTIRYSDTVSQILHKMITRTHNLRMALIDITYSNEPVPANVRSLAKKAFDDDLEAGIAIDKLWNDFFKTNKERKNDDGNMG